MIESCIEWQGTRFKGGYGRVGNKKAHRVAWEQAHGPIPSGLLVLHKCDNPPCVNPDHLYLGTHADNARDRRERDRGVRGSRVNTAKLTEADVHEVRRLCDTGAVHADVARQFGVSQVLVGLIARRKSWSRLPEMHGDPPTEAERKALRKQNAATATKRAWTPERRAAEAARMRERNKGNSYARGRPKSPETRAKMAAARKRWWEQRKAADTS